MSPPKGEPPYGRHAEILAANERLCDGLTEALDLMEGMLIGVAMLKGATGTITIEPSPEMKRLRALIEECRKHGSAPNDV